MDVRAYFLAPVPRWLAIGAFVSVGVAATGVTYFTTRKRYEQIIDERVRTEVAGTEKFLSSLSEKKYATPMEALNALEEDPTIEGVEVILKAENYAGETLVEKENHNVFDEVPERDKDFDFELEVPKRTPDKPYIIEYDEFYESENQTITLTWFEGDEVLADEKDEHIPNIDATVGEDNLLRFGYGSRDPNILYIRNEKMDVDFEVVKNEGKYTEQVLGFIQHEDKVRPRKFRTYDE